MVRLCNTANPPRARIGDGIVTDCGYHVEWTQTQPADQVLDCGCYVTYTALESPEGQTSAITPCRNECVTYRAIVAEMASHGSIEWRDLP